MAKQIRLSIAWALLAFFLFLIGNGSHSLWDRDEPRYAVATQEMLRTGDFIVPHFNGDIRYDKPILTYWLMAPAMAVFGETEFAVRFPSALMGALRVLLLFHFALALGCSVRGASVAAIVAMLSSMLMLISKAATTDSTLILTVVAALYIWWEQQRLGFAWWRHVLFWVVIGLSILVKGPPGIAVVAFAILGYHGWTWWNRRRGVEDHAFVPALPHRPEVFDPITQLTRWGTGLAVMLAVTLPWVIPTWVRTDGEFFREAVGFHVIERTRMAINHHAGPIFYYIPVVILVMLPFTALALNSALWAAVNRRCDAMRLLWSWFVPGFVMFSLVTTKLPHYIAPLLPALALMAGLWWTMHERAATTPRQWHGWRWIGGGFTALAGLAMIVGLPVAVRLAGFPVGLLPFITVGLLLGGALIAGAWFWVKAYDTPALAAWGLSFAIVVPLALLWVMPVLDEFRPSRQLAEWIHANAPEETQLAAVRYQEPSLVFYWGDYVDMVGAEERDRGFALLNDVENPVAMVITAREWEQGDFRRLYGGQVDPRVLVVHNENYYNFEQGRWERLLVVGNWTPQPNSTATSAGN